ncbi:uncharacterized protein zgc:66474 isoform X3 [Hoplias malabaricus]|uniref:uncharacterized protein zgc:66474 isoform X3 n=1 Tax=Hoplias malabaricus TaxID=27720 RepID=UPI0034634563
MTKLQLLHRALNERLMAAVEQVMEMVGGTVLEYEAETIRARKENEVLRRRLRWMEGDIPVDWPDEADPLVPEQLVNVEDDEPVFEGLSIKTEPIDASGSQSFIPDASLMAPVHTTDLETVNPETSQRVTSVDFPDTILWNSTESYMAPLDSDPTVVEGLKGKSRSQRMSFACPDCGKVFGREQTLMFHMRIHSAVRPYAYRRRKACFYGEKSRKKNLQGLSKLHPSKDIMDNIENTSIHSARSTSISPPWTSPCNSPEMASNKEINEVDTGSSKNTDSCAADTTEKRSKRGGKARWPRCLECRRAFKNVQRVRLHMVKAHGKVFPSQEYENEYEDADRAVKRPRKHKPTTVAKKLSAKNGSTLLDNETLNCRHCRAVFSSAFHLRRHMYTHTGEGQSSMDQILAKTHQTLPDNGEKSAQSKLCKQLSKGSGDESECVMEELQDKMERSPKHPMKKIVEPNKITLESERKSEFKTSCNKSERIMNKSREIEVCSKRIPEPTGKARRRRSREPFKCQECGKTYLLFGWLETHVRMHQREKMLKKNPKHEEIVVDGPRQKRMKMEIESLAEEIMMERRQNKNLELVERQHSFNNIGPTRNPQKTEKMPQDYPNTKKYTVKKEQDGGNGFYSCPFCDKVFRRAVMLMVHMQIHLNEKPCSHQPPKEHVYSDRTRAGVAKLFSKEAERKVSDEREKDGKLTFSRNKTSPVSQDDHTSVGRNLSLLPLQSNNAASSHSLNHQRTDSEPLVHALSHSRLQPRIVLQRVIPKSKTWDPCGEDDIRSVGSEASVISDKKAVDAATENAVFNSGKCHLSQTLLENMNACYDSQNGTPGLQSTVISETDDPDILFVRLDLDGKSCENTSYPENVLGYIPAGDQQTTEHYDGRIRDRLEPELVAVETEKSGAPVCDISSITEQTESGFNVSLSSESEIGNIDQCIADVPPTTVSELNSSESYFIPSMPQVAEPEPVCMNISDTNHGDDDDDKSNCHHKSNNLDDKETYTRSKIQIGHLSMKDTTTNELAQISPSVEPLNGTLCCDTQDQARDHTAPEILADTETDDSSLPSSSQKSPDPASDVVTITDITKEQNARDGPPAN